MCSHCDLDNCTFCGERELLNDEDACQHCARVVTTKCVWCGVIGKIGITPGMHESSSCEAKKKLQVFYEMIEQEKQGLKAVIQLTEPQLKHYLQKGLEADGYTGINFNTIKFSRNDGEPADPYRYTATVEGVLKK